LLYDKDYVVTFDGLVFNVIGYDHPCGRVLANLKYVGGRKWKRGYSQGREFLRREYPAYVEKFISVPLEYVERSYFAREGLKKIRAQRQRLPLESTAIELADRLSDRLAIPLENFGVTDSLLWGGTNEQSDIDLIVVMNASENVLLDRLPNVFQHPMFDRLGAENFSRDPTKRKSSDAVIRQRTYHKGIFDGCRFSLRAVRCQPSLGCLHGTETEWVSKGRIQLRSRISSTAESLFFPIIYRLEDGCQMISYFTEHEGILRVGDHVFIQAELQHGGADRLLITQERDEIQLLG
jgi:predicted nucleotidyltransferase